LEILDEMSRLNSWFNSVDRQEKEYICSKTSIQEVPKGHFLFRVGETVDCVAMIRSGVLWAERASFEGRNHIQAVMGPGFFGHLEWPVLNPISRYDVKTIVDTQVFIIPNNIIKSLLERSHEFCKKYLELAVRSHSMLEEYAFVISLYDTTQKLAWIISIIADGYRGLSYPICSIPITQLQLAENMGLTRQSINKGLQQLEDRALIRVGKSNIDIVDIDKLKEMCDFAHLG